jgi:hypothetical protein
MSVRRPARSGCKRERRGDDDRDPSDVKAFDLYGTVVDMEGSLIEDITPYPGSKTYIEQPAPRLITGGAKRTSRTR